MVTFNIYSMRLHTLLLSFALLTFISCGNSTDSDNGDPPPPDPGDYQVQEAFPELSFTNPVDLQHPGDGTDRLFVVEQQGNIYVFENDASVSDKTLFLDITNRVDNTGNEEGLLGLAFHPNYENNGYFYVNYTANNPDRTIISRFEVSANNADQADAASETVILTYEQPFSNHNGGQIAFGPDGYLYIASGDGGSGGDPQGNGQNRATLLGNILRIDVDNTSGNNNYAIPPDNPFVNNNQGYREEIFAYGLRNPWRFSFDPATGRLFTGDVGQADLEEIDIIQSGGNYGWNIMEGTQCFVNDNCDTSGLILPIWEYGHSQGNASITGGFVYRGPTLNNLTGLYIYADFASGRIWALDISDIDNPENTELLDTDLLISSFGVDDENELYICAFDGKIYRLQ